MSFIEGDIILDLAGYTLTGTETATILNAGANLIITNSTVTVGHIQTAVNVVDSEADVFAILIGGGVTKIYGGSIDGLVEFDAGEAELTDLLELYGGVYVDVNGATYPANFCLNDYAEDTVTYTGSDSYFQVGTAAPQPTTYAISWTLTGGTTTATAGDFEENDTIVFTAESGKTLSFVSINGTEISDTSVYGASSYTYTVGTAAATLVVTFTGSSYPTYIDPTDAEQTAKYTSWATYAGVDVATAEVNEDAYLLNCLVSEVDEAKAAFKFTSITPTVSGATCTTTESFKGRSYNGTVTITGYSDVGCTVENAAGPFFKATLD